MSDTPKPDSTSQDTPDATPLASHLIDQIFELDASLLRLRMTGRGRGPGGGPSGRGGGRRGAEFNPRTGQGRILAILSLQPEIEQKELGYLLDMSRQALAELLGKLEKSEFITRTQSENDRRSYVVKLTDKGREVARKLRSEESSAANDPLGLTAVLGVLNATEQENLSDYLDRILAAIREKLGTGAQDDFAEFFRERFFSRHGFDRRDAARFGFDRGPGPREGGFGRDPRSRGGFDPRGGDDGRNDPRNDGRFDQRNEGRFAERGQR